MQKQPHAGASAGAAEEETVMNAIVTVVGRDRVGIIAAVCTLLAENNVNILDITQTILQGSFTMVMAVDLTASAVPLAGLAEKLQALGDSMGISIRIQRQEIFDAMHRI
jgi:ACT domain-containing protein